MEECAEPKLHLGATPSGHSAGRLPSRISGISAKPSRTHRYFPPTDRTLVCSESGGLASALSGRNWAPYFCSTRSIIGAEAGRLTFRGTQVSVA